MGEFLTMALGKVEGNSAILALAVMGIIYVLTMAFLKKNRTKDSFTQLEDAKIEIESKGEGVNIENSFKEIKNTSVKIK